MQSICKRTPNCNFLYIYMETNNNFKTHAFCEEDISRK